MDKLSPYELKPSSGITLGILPCIYKSIEVRWLTITKSNKRVESLEYWCITDSLEGESGTR